VVTVAPKPKRKQSLPAWIEANIILPEGTTARPGAMRLFAYQRGIADAIDDPKVERVSVLKSARVGYTALSAGARRISWCGSRRDSRFLWSQISSRCFSTAPALRETPPLLAVSTLPRVVSLALNAVGYYVKYWPARYR